ncbi:hypothetical protein NDU88_001980 [Pleurodeles waltl]|uniref:Uncharacterized protein n=1 Tax=Pleurodeles waltl TaxID=8319 RepID=A0AAV7T159_PLEWA|nr:hypothetical protein NDU88_001980 [Pleurodeles waltl]
MSQIASGERGYIEQDKEPSQQQVAPGEVPETGTTRMHETVLTRSRTKKSHVAGEQLRRSCNAGQRPSKEGSVVCHRQGGADPGGLRQAEHPLSETVGGPEPLNMENGGGPAVDGLPTRKGCLSNPDPPDGPHTGGGLSGDGWALGGITAATRGKVKVPPPAATVKVKVPPPDAAKRSKEPSQAAAKRCKEPSPAAARQGNGPAPAGRKDKGPGAGTQSEPPPPTMVLQPSEAAGDGQELPLTTTTSSNTSSGHPSEAAGDGQELPPTTSGNITITTTEQQSPPADSV